MNGSTVHEFISDVNHIYVPVGIDSDGAIEIAFAIGVFTLGIDLYAQRGGQE